MVTNINLVSPENESNRVLSGQTALFVSIGLLAITLGLYGAVIFMDKKYTSDKTVVEGEIQAVKDKISGPSYAGIADFEERASSLGQIIENHYYWNDYLKSLSKYVLPDVRFSQFGVSEEGNTISISGIAPSYDVLAKELILLQKFPGASSVQFQKADEDPSGVKFSLNITMNKEALKRDLEKK